MIPIYFTVPATNAYVEGDSIFLCAGGDSTHDVAMIRFIRQDVTGGAPYAFDSLDVRGEEGQPDSIDVDPGPGTHVYAVTVDISGNPSCWSEPAYLPGSVTAVEPGDGWPKPPRMLSMRWYDVQGRPIDYPPKTSMIYWQVSDWSDGTRKVRKLVHLK